MGGMVRTGICALAAASLGLAFTLLGCPDDASDDDTVSTDDDVTGDDDSGGDDDTTGDDDTSGDDDTVGDDDTTGDDDTSGDDDMDLCTAEAPMYVHAHDVLLTFDPAPPGR